MKRFLIAIIITSLAFTTHAQQAEIFSPGGKAIRGYDPVAFFREGKPVKGPAGEDVACTGNKKGPAWKCSPNLKSNIL